MCAATSQSTLRVKLEALQCHFTWGVTLSRPKLFSLRDKLQDIGTEEGYSWLGHIYNLHGYVNFQLGFPGDARRFFSRAAEAFRQMRNTVSDEGAWLVVNHGNLAWLHYHKGEEAESLTFLAKVQSLMSNYPSPSSEELHPEIYAEKAWTLMKVGADQMLKAADFFQRALRMQPGMAEWHTSHVLASVNAFKNSSKEPGADVLEKMRIAKEHDPHNLYLSALYLEACAKRGNKIEDEARELARRVLRKPVSSYSGIKPLLRLYRMYVSMDEAIDLAEELLERHPGERYLKRCAAVCYKMRISSDRDNPLERSMVDRAVALSREVISLYPDSSLKRKIHLANMYGELNRQEEADLMFQELLQSELEPEGAQMLYHYFAKHVHFVRKESYKSIEYHMRAAEIPLVSYYRENSIRTLQRIRDRNRNRMCGDIREFLDNLQDYS